MKTTERLELVPVDQLIGYARNARVHSPEQIAQLRASLREYGFVNPILADKDLNVIAGHGRLMAAKEEGIAEVPCVFVEHLTEAQKKAYILADNRLALSASWDDDLLRIELEELQELDFNVELTGFTDAEVSKLFSDGVDAKDDDFDVDAALDQPSIALPGDLWLLGRHRLLCGDATKPEDIALLMDGKQAHCVVTDPPYNVDYSGKSKKLAGPKKIIGDNLCGDAFYDFLLAAFRNMESVMAQDASIYVFHADTEGLNFRRAFSDAGFYLSGTCIWQKNGMVLGRSPYHWQHEPILYGWKKSGKHAWFGDRKQTTIWPCDKPVKNDQHPTAKPVPLLARPISNSTMTGSVVLDPFLGGGSTLITCEQLDRVCFATELDPRFVSVSVRRYVEHKGGGADVHVQRGGETLPYGDVI